MINYRSFLHKVYALLNLTSDKVELKCKLGTPLSYPVMKHCVLLEILEVTSEHFSEGFVWIVIFLIVFREVEHVTIRPVLISWESPAEGSTSSKVG